MALGYWLRKLHGEVWQVISSFLLSEPSLSVFSTTSYFVKDMKNKSHPKVTFKWSSVDQGLLPALSGVVKTNVLTVQR